MASEVKHGVCNLCEAICGLKITLTDGAITDIRGDQDDPLSRGHICPKGVALADLYADPDRLRRPLRRRRNPADPTGASDTWDELGWPEALDLAASRLAEVVARGGRDSVGVYLGNPNAHSLGFATHGLALVKSLGTKNLFSASSVDQLPHQLVAHWMFGHQLMLPIPDLDRTDHFLVIGANPMASNGSLMTAPDFPSRMRELRQRGGRLVVLDPRRTETAKIADEHHFVRPGSDVFVMLAMVATLIADGVATWPAYAAVDRAQLEAALAPFTPERAEAASGLPAADVCRLAREFAAAKAAVAYGRLGVSATEHGTLGVWAITLLNTLTGNLDQAGGAMFTTPAIDIVGRRIVGPGHHGLWRSRVRGLPETANEFPVAALAEEIQTPGKGQIKALLTIAGNPVLSTPDGAGLERALEQLDFMVAVDFYLNETTRHADLILPPTSHLERDHYDLVFSALAVRNTARFTPAVLPTQAGSLADWRIFAGLARRLAAKTRLPLRRRLTLSARLAASPRQIVRLLLRQGDSGLTLAAVLARPSGVDLGPLRPGMLPERLQTEDGKVDLFPAPIAAALAALEDLRPLADGELLLIGRRHQRDCNSWMHNSPRLTKGRARHHLLIHPDDLQAAGLTDGGLAEVTSAVGTVRVETRASDEIMPGVVSLPHGYGHSRDAAGPTPRLSRASAVEGASPNDLTDPSRLDVSGNAALNGVPVRVQPPPNV